MQTWPPGAVPFLLVFSTLGLTSGGCSTASGSALEAARTGEPTELESSLDREVSRLRARGQNGLDEALARFDAAPTGLKREAESLVDRVAAQRYATVSRMFWHTDFESAIAAARLADKPIVSLRMLGRLDEELSCANSRMFRVILYANEEVSAYLREDVVLHWSTEREVPKITLDYGDGRVIETTVGGNSAHYVLDSSGRPVDVLPGLYGPTAFLTALRGAVVAARATVELEATERILSLASYHAKTAKATETATFERPGQSFNSIYGGVRTPGTMTIGSAQMLTVSKAFVEQPMVRTVRLGGELAKLAREEDLVPALAGVIKNPGLLDAASRKLIARLAPTDWRKTPSPISGALLDQLISRLEIQISADTALAELGLRREIHGWFAAGNAPTFDELNRRVYREIFLTPADDPWLGVATPGVFTALPMDGHRAVEPF